MHTDDGHGRCTRTMDTDGRRGDGMRGRGSVHRAWARRRAAGTARTEQNRTLALPCLALPFPGGRGRAGGSARTADGEARGRSGAIHAIGAGGGLLQSQRLVLVSELELESELKELKKRKKKK